MTDPMAPYAEHMLSMMQRMERDAAAAPLVESPHAGAGPAVRGAVEDRVAALETELVDLSHDIHAHPELMFEEHHAVAAVARVLAAHGHDAEVGAYGLPTALRARAGSGRPRVAILAEYDALPGIGHACGHNVICTTAVGAFLALAPLVADLGGSIELIGAPAEEGGGGKELIARAGGFDEVDAAVMIHPAGFDAAVHPWLGLRTVDVVYRGHAAHASAMPFLGRNALDAVVAAYTDVAALRQHMLDSDRVHGVITDGGKRPNIVPERAAAQFLVRSSEPETLKVLCQKVQAVMDAAALATGTVAEVTWDPAPAYLPVRNNIALASRWAVNVAPAGRRALPMGVIPPTLTGSTDLGNVSVRIPAIQPMLAIAPGLVVIHTEEFARHAVSAAADRGCLEGSVGLALTSADFLVDEDLRRAVAGEFAAAGGVLDMAGVLGSG